MAPSAPTPLPIEQMVVRHIRMRLRQPFVTALGVEDRRDIVIVEAHGGGGVGYGEVPVLARPVYNEETVNTAWHVLNDFFVPRLLSRPVTHPGDVARRLAAYRGHAMAKAGVEGAVWDLWARRRGMSLSRALGGVRRRVAAGVVLGIADEDALLQAAESSLRQGYRRIKVKIEPGRDADVLGPLRRQFPDIDLAADANGAYRPADADVLRGLDRFGLSMLEQPLAREDLLEHARLQKTMATPICLDESVSTRRHAAQALELGSCRMFNIKAPRVGGLTEALAIHDLAVAAGVPVWCGGMLETGIGRAHNVALASLPGFTLPGDLSASERYWAEDIVHPPFALDADGFIPVPRGPGIGVQVDEERLRALTVRVQVHRLRERPERGPEQGRP